jgi:hypothetical protein
LAQAAELSRSVVPPGGFIFDQALSDGSYARISGASLDQVLELILRYRQVNGMVLASGTVPTPEAVWADYNAQVCGKYPWLCTGVREPPPATVAGGSGSGGWELLLLRMQRWLDSIRGSGIEWVEPKTAADRALVCANCPQNVAWETNCSSCNQTLTQGSAAVRGARRLGIDSFLKGCRAFGTLQEVAVWIRDPGGEKRYEAPPPCWRL